MFISGYLKTPESIICIQHKRSANGYLASTHGILISNSKTHLTHLFSKKKLWIFFAFYIVSSPPAQAGGDWTYPKIAKLGGLGLFKNCWGGWPSWGGLKIVGKNGIFFKKIAVWSFLNKITVGMKSVLSKKFLYP